MFQFVCIGKEEQKRANKQKKNCFNTYMMYDHPNHCSSRLMFGCTAHFSSI